MRSIQGLSGAAAISAPAIGWLGYAGEACTQRIQAGSSRTGGQSDQRRNQRRAGWSGSSGTAVLRCSSCKPELRIGYRPASETLYD